MTKTVYL